MRRLDLAWLVVGAVALPSCFTLLTNTDDLEGTAVDSGAADGDGSGQTDGAADTAPEDPLAILARDPALVLRYSFDENAGLIAHDSSGHQRDGELNAGAAWTAGVFNGAIAFDRDAAGGTTSPCPGLGSSSLSASLWVKSVDTVGPQSRLFGYGWETGYCFLNFNMGSPALECQSAKAYWGSGLSVSPIADGAWHHVAIVIDKGASQTRLFIDGAEGTRGEPYYKDAGPDASDEFGAPSSEYLFTIGSQSTTVAIRFGGVIDEFWLFARALQDSELAALARRPP